MQTITRRIGRAALSASLMFHWACEPALDEDPGRGRDPAVEPGPLPPGDAEGGSIPERSPVKIPLYTIAVAGFTSGGAVGLFDARTGADLATVPEGEVSAGGADGGDRDLALDPWLSRLLVFQRASGAMSGEIVAYPIVDGSGALSGATAPRGPGLALGARQHLGSASGPLRLAPSPFGGVALDDPAPASLATRLLPDGRMRLSALTYGDDGQKAALHLFFADAEGLSPPVELPLPVTPASHPLTVRRVETASDGALFDVLDGDIVVSAKAGGGFSAWMPAGLGSGISRIKQAVSWPGGGRVALSITGAFDVAVVSLGAGGAPECGAALDLPGESASRGAPFARDVVLSGPNRLLAATSSGVFAVVVSRGCPPELALDFDFEGEGLRGPLDDGLR